MSRFAFVAAAALSAACGSRTEIPGPEGSGDAPEWTLPVGCDDEDGRLSIFVLSNDNLVFSFDPRDLSVAEVGRLTCPTEASPNSMAISRDGIGYISYDNGQLFQMDMGDALCIPTPFDTRQLTYERYGLGFLADGDRGETLYGAEHESASFSPGLIEIDTTTFELRFVTPFDPPLTRLELTGTGDGRLFGYEMDEVGSRLVVIDRSTGRVRTEQVFSFGAAHASFDFAFWGGDFYFFVSTASGTSDVWHYQPDTRGVRLAGQVDAVIVGAGVTTCAPLATE